MIKLARSYFFEFSGMPKSGKTTTIESIRHFYKRLGFKVRNYSGHDRRIDIDKSNARELNIVLASRAVEYIVAHSVRDREPTIHFMDRGIFDRSVFTEIEFRHNNISSDEANTLTKYLLMEDNCKLVDGLFVFSVPTEISLKREYNNTLLKMPGRIMNDSFLTEYQNVLAECYEKGKERFKIIDWITTEHDTPQQTSIYVAEQIWKIIGGNMNEFPILQS